MWRLSLNPGATKEVYKIVVIRKKKKREKQRDNLKNQKRSINSKILLQGGSLEVDQNECLAGGPGFESGP